MNKPTVSCPRIFIEKVTPALEGGHPVKGVAGEPIAVEADIFRDGLAAVRAVLQWKGGATGGAPDAIKEEPFQFFDNDRWRGQFTPLVAGPAQFRIVAWTDPYETWFQDFQARVASAQPLDGEKMEGLRIMRSRASHSSRPAAKASLEAAALVVEKEDSAAALTALRRPEIVDSLRFADPREGVVETPWFSMDVDRCLARFGSWYELFPRSQGTVAGRGGTFADVERRLPDLRDMGFDVLYLTPIHPIGRTARKGRNGSVNAGPQDPGSPWAIGSEKGGHTEIDPSLGSVSDFQRLVKKANEMGMEIALDFAVQCSPDHPWVKEHPDWFYHREDGSIRCAENPPYRYEDIYPLNFDSTAWSAMWEEMRRVVLYWLEKGVRVFRVDNPHTKPFAFWKWLISEARSVDPGAIFLAEAFTRPKIMFALSKIGFSQTYTYFTWRISKAELTGYVTELGSPPVCDFLRPNFFVNTHDNIHEYLQRGGRPAFRARLALAATLSPSYGVYSGFELCESEAVPGTEHYQNAETFEIRLRDWNRDGNIKEDVRRLNRLRKENKALHVLSNVEFAEVANDQLIAFIKRSDDGEHAVVTIVNLDPARAQEGVVKLPFEKIGWPASTRLKVRDALTDAVYEWGQDNFVRLDPVTASAHVLAVEARWS